jgi:hypothetical protein
MNTPALAGGSKRRAMLRVTVALMMPRNPRSTRPLAISSSMISRAPSMLTAKPRFSVP